MDTTNLGEQLVIFLLEGLGATLLFVMPGYLLGVVFSRGLRGPALEEKAFLATALFGGLVVHLALLVWTVPLARSLFRDGVESHILEIALWAAVVLIVTPVVLGVGLARLSEVRSPRWLYSVLRAIGLSSTVRTAEAWNWVFRQEFPAYVRIHLKDEGGTVYGWFGGSSFASSDASIRDVYLQQQWVERNGQFDEPLPTTRGVWISGDVIASVEFFAGEEEEE